MSPESADPAVSDEPGWLHPAVVFAAAVVGHLPALGAWWCRDDWLHLARAAGVIDGDPGLPARWLSSRLYWELSWPLLGLDAVAHAAVRLVLHGLAAVVVVRLGRRAGLGRAAGLGAGLLFAATPLAFAPLYWASDVGELMAAVLALLAVERWLAGYRRGRRAHLVAVAAGALAMLSADTALGLPIVLLVFLWAGIGVRLEDKGSAWALVTLLLMFAAAETVLVVQGLGAGAGTADAAESLGSFGGDLGAFGWWLLSPGPVLAGRIAWPMAAAGGVFFLLWLAWGAVRWRHGHRLPLMALAGCLLALLPDLAMRPQVAPSMAYLAGAGWCLALASALPRRLPLPGTLLLGLALAAAAWGFFGMRARLTLRSEMGLPADAIVAATSMSWEASRTLRGLDRLSPALAFDKVTILQIPVGTSAREQAMRFGPSWVSRSDLRAALAGDVGPNLVLGSDGGIPVRWANNLAEISAGTMVLAESNTGLRFWGLAHQAVLYAAMTDIGLGYFERARVHLRRAAVLNDDQVGFVFDEGQMIVPLDAVLQRKVAFVDWTLSLVPESASPTEVGGMQEMFFNLLSSATGKSVEELTSGSRVLRGKRGLPSTGPRE